MSPQTLIPRKEPRAEQDTRAPGLACSTVSPRVEQLQTTSQQAAHPEGFAEGESHPT